MSTQSRNNVDLIAVQRHEKNIIALWPQQRRNVHLSNVHRKDKMHTSLMPTATTKCSSHLCA